MNWKNKKVFISGGAGVIGTALVNKLLAKGAIVFVGDLKPRPYEFPKEVIYRMGDLNYITKEEIEYFSPEIFFHLAATFERSLETKDFWDENFHHNIQLTHHLISCVKDLKTLKKIIFASSYLVYNPKLYSFEYPKENPVKLKETDDIMPRNLCGAAKLYNELELLFWNNFRPNYQVVIARIFRVYGRNSRDVISRWIKDLIENKEITLYRKEGKFDFIFADDVAEGLIRLAESEFSGIVNLGSGCSRKIEEIIKILSRYFPNMKVKEIESNIPFEASEADIDKLKKITNWQPEIKLEEGIPILIDFYKKNKNVSNQPLSINILVTSISNKVPLLTAVRQALANIGNCGKIFGADMNKDCIGKYFVDKFWTCPPLKKLKISELIDYCKENSISYIIPTRDEDLLYFAKHKKHLERNGIKVMVSEYKSIYNCIDKLKFFRVLNKKGFPVIKTSDKIEEIEAKRYVVKERFGAGSRNIGLNLSKSEAILHASKLKNPVFQPFIKGEEFSVDLYVTQNKEIKGVIVRKREVVIDGESKITYTVKNKEIEQICSEVALYLNLYGHIVFQVIQDQKNNYFLLECNPRFGGASTLSLSAGLDSFYWFLLESIGEDIGRYPFIFTPKKLVRYPADKIFII